MTKLDEAREGLGRAEWPLQGCWGFGYPTPSHQILQRSVRISCAVRSAC